MTKINKYIDKIFKIFLKIKFVKNNYILVQKSLIIIWFIFIIKLFLFWIRISTWWGWFINFSILPTFHYSWTNAWIISIILFVLFLYFLYKISQKEKKLEKIKLVFLIFILWIFSNQIFLLISPDFRFYLTPVIKQYKNKDWTEVNDIDKYLKLVNKYCISDDFFFKMDWRYWICASNSKLESDFNSADEYIKVLKSANNNNFHWLYSVTIKWLLSSKFIEETIEKYNDDTFYAYLIINYWREKEILNFIESINLNLELKIILEEYKKWLKEYNEKKLLLNVYKSDELYKKLKIEIINRFKIIEIININLLY
jgi:hypothetical protein